QKVKERCVLVIERRADRSYVANRLVRDKRVLDAGRRTLACVCQVHRAGEVLTQLAGSPSLLLDSLDDLAGQILVRSQTLRMDQSRLPRCTERRALLLPGRVEDRAYHRLQGKLHERSALLVPAPRLRGKRSKGDRADLVRREAWTHADHRRRDL